MLGADLDAAGFDAVDLDAQQTGHAEVGGRAFLESETARDVDEARDPQRGVVDRGTDRLLGHVEQYRHAAGGHHVARWRGDARDRGRREAGLEVQRHAHESGVDLHIDASGRQLEVIGIETVDRDGVDMRFQRGELLSDYLELHQREIDALGAETIERAGLLGEAATAVDAVLGVADEDVDVGAADGESFGVGQRVARAGDDGAEIAFLESERALDVDELRDRQRALTNEEAESVALEVQRDRIAAGGHSHVVLAAEVQRIGPGGRAVVLNRQVFERELEVLGVEAVDRHQRGVGLERAVRAAGLVLDAEVAEIQVVDAETVEPVGLLAQRLGPVYAAVGVTDEGGDIAAADRESRGANHLGSSAVDQSVAVIGLLETYRSREVHEAGDRQRGVAGVNAQPVALEVQRDRRAARGHCQIAAAAEVEGRSASGRAVVLDRQILGRELEVVRVETVQGHAVGMGLERAVFAPSLVLDAEVGEVQAVDSEAIQVVGLRCQRLAAVDAAVGVTDEGGDVAAADREAFGADNGSALAVLERVAEISLLEADRAREVQEIRDRQRGVAGVNAQPVALEVQRDRRAARGHCQIAAAAEVEGRSASGRAVVLDRQILGRELEVVRVETVQGHAVGMGLERAVFAPSLVLDAEVGEVQAVDSEAIQVVGLRCQRLAAVDAAVGVTDEGGDVAAADREAFGADNGSALAVLERVAEISLLEADRAREVQEVRDRQRRVLGKHADALATRKVHHDLAVRPQRQAAGTEGLGIVDGRATRRALVDLHRQTRRREFEHVGVEAVERKGVGVRLERRVGLTARLGQQQAEIQVLDAKAIQVVALLLEGLAAVDAAIGIAYESVYALAGDRQHR